MVLTQITGDVIIPSVFDNLDGLYKDFFLATPSPSEYFEGIASFIHANGWKKAFYVSDAVDYFNDFDNAFIDACDNLNITVDPSYKMELGQHGPSYDTVDRVVTDLKKREARIIVFMTLFNAPIVCHMYRLGLYGPGIVLLQYGLLAFRPDTPLRFLVPNCTQEHLYEVSKSIIFYGDPAKTNFNPNVVDSFGISSQEFQSTMKSRIENPQTSFSWWYFRTLYYDLVSITGLILNRTVDVMERNNEMIDNWNQSKIFRSILKESIHTVQHEGLFDDFNVNGQKWNVKIGPTAFYQVQVLPEYEFDKTVPLSDKLYNAPVALYSRGKLTLGPNRLLWRTKRTDAPRDSILVIEKFLPSFNSTSQIVLTVVAVLALVVSIFFVALTIKRSKSMRSSQPLLNSFILLGIVMDMTAVVIISNGSNSTTNYHLYCMSGIVLMVTGTFTLYASIACKLLIASMSIKAKLSTAKGRRQMRNINTFGSSASSASSTMRTVNSRNQTPVSNSYKFPIQQLQQIAEGQRQRRRGAEFDSRIHTLVTVCLVILVAILNIIWFIHEPLILKTIHGKSTALPEDVSVVYREYTRICVISGPSSIIFIGITASFFGIIAIAFVLLALSIPKNSLKHSAVSNVESLKISGYGMVMISLAALMAAPFFTETLLTVVCSFLMAMAISTLTISFFVNLKDYFKGSQISN